jgi:hypothetical protein
VSPRSELELVRTDSPDRWAAAARASGQSVTPFHSYPFLTVAAGLTGRWFRPLVVRHAGADVGVAPWLSRRRGPTNLVDELPFPYVGPLVPGPLAGGCLAALWDHGIRTRVVSQEFQFPPGCDVDLDVLRASGFGLRMASTFIIDTRCDEEALWAGMDRECRRKIRKSERAGVEVAASAEASETLSRVMGSVFERAGSTWGYQHPLPLRPEHLDRHGLEAHWTVATLGDTHLGSLLTLLYEGRALGWLGGVLPEHRATNANLAMYWDAISWARGRSAESLDMVGVPSRGIESFKKQFGGRQVDYPVLTRDVPGLRQLRGGVDQVKALLGRAGPAWRQMTIPSSSTKTRPVTESTVSISDHDLIV